MTLKVWPEPFKIGFMMTNKLLYGQDEVKNQKMNKVLPADGKSKDL